MKQYKWHSKSRTLFSVLYLKAVPLLCLLTLILSVQSVPATWETQKPTFAICWPSFNAFITPAFYRNTVNAHVVAAILFHAVWYLAGCIISTDWRADDWLRREAQRSREQSCRILINYSRAALHMPNINGRDRKLAGCLCETRESVALASAMQYLSDGKHDVWRNTNALLPLREICREKSLPDSIFCAKCDYVIVWISLTASIVQRGWNSLWREKCSLLPLWEAGKYRDLSALQRENVQWRKYREAGCILERTSVNAEMTEGYYTEEAPSSQWAGLLGEKRLLEGPWWSRDSFREAWERKPVCVKRKPMMLKAVESCWRPRSVPSKCWLRNGCSSMYRACISENIYNISRRRESINVQCCEEAQKLHESISWETEIANRRERRSVTIQQYIISFYGETGGVNIRAQKREKLIYPADACNNGGLSCRRSFSRLWNGYSLKKLKA